MWGAAGAFGCGRRGAQPGVSVSRKVAGSSSTSCTTFGWTLLLILLAAITLMLLFLGGGIASDLLGEIELGDFGPSWSGTSCAGRAPCSSTCSSTRSCTTRRRTSRSATSATSPPARCSAFVLWIVASAGVLLLRVVVLQLFRDLWRVRDCRDLAHLAVPHERRSCCSAPSSTPWWTCGDPRNLPQELQRSPLPVQKEPAEA